MTPRNDSSQQLQWILAFDANCETCGEISRVVSEACDGKLQVLPLAHPVVWKWREERMGADAPSAPTLIKADESGALGIWTGKRMVLPLVRRLGARSSMRVLAALGQLKESVNEPLSSSSAQPSGMSRKRFLRVGAGAMTAGGILLAGNAPAFAEQRKSAAAAWVTANSDRLPKTYSDIITYSLDYRREIYRALPAQTRSKLWCEHLRTYRAEHPVFTPAQEAALQRVEAAFAKDSMFEAARSDRPQAVQADEAMRRELIAAFGEGEAYAIAASLGPSPGLPQANPGVLGPLCSCSPVSDWCSGGSECGYSPCQTQTGCGTGWQHKCTGLCLI
ncbi:bacteriocin fulvocin C-related protein [Streptomyces syringium]|uniref:bacteriocin fulvocin C-related protein n=1 Tax=Streptomyces syringium TaxID=76729 RepID=UPI003D8E457C